MCRHYRGSNIVDALNNVWTSKIKKNKIKYIIFRDKKEIKLKWSTVVATIVVDNHYNHNTIIVLLWL